MKKFLLFVVLTVFGFSLFADSVSQEAAMKIAKNFYLQIAKNKSDATLEIAYVYETITVNENKSGQSSNLPLFYIFNVNQNDGFVIVTADDIVTPILGYCDKGSWNVNNLPPALQELMENYKKQIIYAKENNLSATDEIKSKWDELVNKKQNNKNIYASNKYNKSLPSLKSSVLLQTANWNQGNTNAGGFYNDLCPSDLSLPINNSQCYNLSTRCLTGCPATAMAIIMKYWSYPATGSGIHSYNHPTYGTLSANFGSTTYNWSAMPLTDLTSTNNDVATIMYQCGVSVEMNYGSCGSYGWVITADNAVCSQSAYTTYFGYDPSTIQGLKRSSYSDPSWINLLKNELNNNRPIQYTGLGTGGHTFVCDGYDANNYFHFNWGWGGYANGYFDINALTPGTENFNSGQQALIGIQPGSAQPPQASDLQIYSAITVNPNPINFGQSFSVSTSIANPGSTDVAGTFAAALFNSQGIFVDFIQTITGTISASTYNTATFTTSGMTAPPGNYTLGIYYMPSGGSWSLIAQGSYTNPVNVTIAGIYNDIQLYSDIAVTPNPIIQNQAASVSASIANAGSSVFYGYVGAFVYNLDGSYNQTIEVQSNLTFQSGYYYNLTFNTSNLYMVPGTYLLVLGESPDGNNWYIVGSTTSYSNPIYIIISAPPLPPDQYEPNNTEATAYNLPISWSGNSANPNTTGSNIHIGTDVDFYNINLASGYNYTITARVDDSYSSGNGNTYTCNVIWSYDTGSGWSSVYDDIMPGNISVNGGGIVTFEVAPYFSGMTGTYLLDINITRITGSGVNEIADNNKLFEIYPNPTTNYLTLKYFNDNHSDNLQVINLMGQVVLKIKSTSPSPIENIDVSNLPNGIYYIEAINIKQKYYSKFIIAR